MHSDVTIYIAEVPGYLLSLCACLTIKVSHLAFDLSFLLGPFERGSAVCVCVQMYSVTKEYFQCTCTY